jgi:hypothetical protein
MPAVQPINRVEPGAVTRGQKLVQDQLGLALRNLRPNAWMMPALAAVICVMFHQWIAAPRLLLWFTIVAAACVPLGIVSRRYGHVESLAEDPGRRVAVSTAAYLAGRRWVSSCGCRTTICPA